MPSVDDIHRALESDRPALILERAAFFRTDMNGDGVVSMTDAVKLTPGIANSHCNAHDF